MIGQLSSNCDLTCPTVTLTHLTSQMAAQSVSSAHLHHQWHPGGEKGKKICLQVSSLEIRDLCATPSSPTGDRRVKNMQHL